ncbi:MAG: hypothetical protein P1V97_28325, partial [Planctomycetota bacterium]|nr:hypothetical protein [Planctomycetota bacterium]
MPLSSRLILSCFILAVTACARPQKNLVQDKAGEDRPPTLSEMKHRSQAQEHKKGKRLWERCEKVGPTLSKLLKSKGLDKKTYSLTGFTGTLNDHLAVIGLKTQLAFELTDRAEKVTQDHEISWTSRETLTIPEILETLLARSPAAITSYVVEETIIIATKAERETQVSVYIHDVSDIEKTIQSKRLAESFSWDPSSKVTAFKEARPILELLSSYQSLLQKDSSVKYSAGFIVARLPYFQQEKLAWDISQLRRDSQSQITIEARFLRISSKVVREIMATQFSDESFTGNSRKASSPSALTLPGQAQSINAPALLASKRRRPWGDRFSVNKHQVQALLDFVKKSQKITSVHAPRLTIYNGQRMRVSHLCGRAYIKDIEVSSSSIIQIEPPVFKV